MQKLSILFVTICVFLIHACSTTVSTTNEATFAVSSTRGNVSEESPAPDQRAKLHAILVADTENRGADWLGMIPPKEEIGAKKDLEDMSTFLKSITKDVETINLEFHILEGKEFAYGSVISVISQLNPNQNDVVLFYYTGHGVNRSGYGLPNLVLGKDEGDQPVLDSIVSQVKEKGVNFFVILADACNSFYRMGEGSNVIKGMKEPNFKDFKVKNFKKLFLDRYGYIIGVASKSGQAALGGTGGGRFTAKVMENLTNELQSTSPSWDNFKKETEIRIQGQTTKGMQVTQEPSIEIDLIREKSPPSLRILAVSMKMLPTTRLSVGSKIEIQFTNQSRDTAGFLVAWDIDSRDKVTMIVPSPGEEIKLEPTETKPSTSEIIEPVGKSFLVAILVEDRRKFDVLKGLKPANRQQLLNQLRRQGLKPTEVEYEIIK